MTFDSDNAASSHVDVLTREVQAGFKRLDAEIRAMVKPEAHDDDAQVGQGTGVAACHWQTAVHWRPLPHTHTHMRNAQLQVYIQAAHHTVGTP